LWGAGGTGGQGGNSSGLNTGTLSAGQTTPLVLNGGNGGDGGRGGWLHGLGGAGGQGGTGSSQFPSTASLTVGGNFNVFNNTPGSHFVSIASFSGINSVSPSSATIATGGTAQFGVMFSGTNTSGTVSFGTLPAGTPGHAGAAGANGMY
jgi:hypothetical protein